MQSGYEKQTLASGDQELLYLTLLMLLRNFLPGQTS